MDEPAIEPRWDTYVVLAGEDPLGVEFDEAAGEPALRAALPALLRVELEVVAPDESGWPGAVEARQLGSEEDELFALLDRHQTGGRPIARTTCRGTRELWIALPEPGRADFALRKWARRLEREVGTETVGTGWSFVDEHLLPGPDERAWMAARDAGSDAEPS